MNFLKKLMIALSAALMLWSCSDDDESTNGSNATISLSNNIIQVDKNGGDANVTITSSDDWRLSGVCDWAHPSITSGKSGDVVTFTIDANTQDEKRTAIFKFFTGSSVVSLQVESEISYIIDLVSDANPSISNSENMIRIELNTNIADLAIAYSDGGEKWLTLDKRVDFGDKTTLILKAIENETYKKRSTTITISSPLAKEPINVSLAQKQTDAIIPENNTFINDLAARSISFKVKYNVDHVITIPQGSEWITGQTVSEPQIGDDGLSTITLSYKLSDASATRGGSIRIARTDGSLTSDISIVQKDPNIKLTEIPDNVLRSICISNKWALSITNSQCVILEAGLEATSLINSSYYNQIADLTGIENFPNLTSLHLGTCTDMKKLDISALHKVSTLTFSKTRYCDEYDLGDNPITTTFNLGGTSSYLHTKSLKVSSSKVQSINLSLTSYNANNDEVTSIDVSECPALTTLDANRSDKVKTLYLRTGQVIPNLTKNAATTIVYK